MTVGMTLIEVNPNIPKDVLGRMIRKAMSATPEGRQLCVTFPLPDAWGKTAPYEAIITNAVLGRPSERTEPHEWVFSGNICVRRCKVIRGKRQVVGEVGVLMFRRSGDMAYKKRTQVDEVTIDSATLETLHPAFTRDVANNVWHLPVQCVGKLRNRLQALFTWPGEVTLLLQPISDKKLSWQPLALDDALIGVPTKQDYPWATHAALHQWAALGEAVL